MKPLLKPIPILICTTLRCGRPLLGCLLETKLLVEISVSGRCERLTSVRTVPKQNPESTGLRALLLALTNIRFICTIP